MIRKIASQGVPLQVSPPPVNEKKPCAQAALEQDTRAPQPAGAPQPEDGASNLVHGLDLALAQTLERGTAVSRMRRVFDTLLEVITLSLAKTSTYDVTRPQIDKLAEEIRQIPGFDECSPREAITLLDAALKRLVAKHPPLRDNAVHLKAELCRRLGLADIASVSRAQFGNIREIEKEILAAHYQRTTFALYDQTTLDPKKPTVVLTHGWGGPLHPGFEDLANSLKDQGYQVLLLMWDSCNTRLTDVSAQLAETLSALRANYFEQGTPISFVGQSAGPLVIRAALSELQHPGALSDCLVRDPNPRGGFGECRLVSLDTPLAGYRKWPKGLRWLLSLPRLCMKASGYGSGMDMWVGGGFLEKAYAQSDLASVKTHQITAQDPPKDKIGTNPSILEAPAKVVLQVVNAMLSGVEPEDERARFYFLALRDDERYSFLEAMLKDAGGNLPAGETWLSTLRELHPDACKRLERSAGRALSEGDLEKVAALEVLFLFLFEVVPSSHGGMPSNAQVIEDVVAALGEA